MTPLKVKEKLNDFFKAYNSEAGLLNSLRVIYDYVSFLKSDPYIKGKLGDIMAYGDKQKELAITNINKIKGDLRPSFDGVADLGVFTDELKMAKEMAETEDDSQIKLKSTLGLQYTNLLLIYSVMAEVKKQGDDKFLNFAKELPLKSMAFQYPTNNQNVALSSFQYFGLAMGLINKYLIGRYPFS